MKIAHGHGCDLHRGFWDAGHPQDATRGWVLGKVTREDIVQFAVVISVLQIDLDVDDVIDRETGGFEYLFYVVKRLANLIAEICRSGAVGTMRTTLTFDPTNAVSFLTPRGAFTDLVSSAVEDVTGRRPELSTGGGTSDARFIKNACPVIDLGLPNATIHAVDERVALADLEGLTRIYERVLERYFREKL